MDPATLKSLYEPKTAGQLACPTQLCRLRYSPCGKLLAAAGYDGLVRRFSTQGGDGKGEHQELAPIAGHHGWVTGLAFAPLGERLFSADSWGMLAAWDYLAEHPAPRWTQPAAHEGWIRGLAVSPDGACVATCGGTMWGGSSATAASVEGASSPAAFAVKLWHFADGTLLRELTGHTHLVHALAFHPSGQLLASGDHLGQLRIWNLSSGECVRTWEAAGLYKEDRLQEVGGVRALAFTADGSLLAVAGAKVSGGATVLGVPTVLLFESDSGQLRHALELGTANDVFVTDMAFHPAGFLMAVTCGQPGTGKLVFRRLEDAAAFFESSAVANSQSLALHPTGRRLAVATVNANSNGNGRQLNAQGVYPGNFSPVTLLDFPASAD